MTCFKNKKRYYFIMILTIIFLISFYSIGFSSTLKTGFPAPTFSLKTIEGENFNLRDQREKQKLLILYFYSQDNYDSLTGVKKLVEYFEDYIIQEKYEVFFVNTQEKLQEKDIELMKVYLSDNKIPFPIILDSQKKVSELYNIDTLPTAIFLDNNLVVKRVYPGIISNQQTLMFQYMSYFLASEKKEIPKKEKKEKEEVVEEPDVCTCIKKPSF
ncbi:MAG: redoxin domain-containing protein [Atribacterota bacterium]